MIPQPAGLNLQQLRGIAARRRGSRAHQHLLDRIGEHLDEHDGFVSWSGGKDSTVVVDLARQVDPHIPVVFFDSGLQFPETIQYLEDLSDTWRLNYHVIAADPDLLTVLIAGGGFSHEAPDRRLRGQMAEIMITGPANEAHSRYGRGSLWGVRAEESHGRRMLYRRSLATETLHNNSVHPKMCGRRQAVCYVAPTAPSPTGRFGIGNARTSSSTWPAAASSPTRCTASWPNSGCRSNRSASTPSSTRPNCPTVTSPGCSKAGPSWGTGSPRHCRGFVNGSDVCGR